MKLQDGWVNNAGTQSLCAVLGLSGYRALFVGGCVRNALLGAPVTDIDIATDAWPETVTEIAQAAGFKVIPTGIDHGTVTVIAQGVHHEVTTFRRDVETDGRRAVVVYSTDIAEDAARRDFTINALYAEPSGEVIDPLGGIDDLTARRIRFVGEPAQRIREDYLRILRFFRFYAVYGDSGLGMDPEGLAACAELADGLDQLSRERVGGEMRKLLAAENPAPAVSAMAQAGVLARILPGADARALGVLVHLEDGIAPRWQRRLALLGGEGDLRLSKAEQSDLSRIRDEIGSTASAAVLGWTLGEIPAQDVLLCRAALFGQPLAEGWKAHVQRGAQSKFPVLAADLMPDMFGPALGERLKALQARWLASDLTMTRAELLKIAQNGA